MEDQTTVAEPAYVGKTRRTTIVLVDCLEQGDGGLFGPGSEGYFLLRLGSLLASGSGGRVLLCSVVSARGGESLSSYSMAAQARRQDLERMAIAALTHWGSGVGDWMIGDGERRQTPTPDLAHGLIAPVVRVARDRDVAAEVREVLESEPNALLLLPLRPSGMSADGAERSPAGCRWLNKALRRPQPCDVAWARPPLVRTEDRGLRTESVLSDSVLSVGARVLVPARGGPQAALALDLSQDLMDALRAQVTVLHVLSDLPEQARASEEAPFTELIDHLRAEERGPSRDDVRPVTVDPRLARPSILKRSAGDDPAGTISALASEYDLLIMGAGEEHGAGIGRFTEQVAGHTGAALIAVKSRIPVGPAIRAARRRARPHVLDPESLSLLVDKWFAENTFHSEEFRDLNRLVDIKRKQGTTISLGLPALNEEDTIGEVIKTLKYALMDEVPLLDEIVVVDSDSTDRTREIAAEMGVPVCVHQQVLPEAGTPLQGKGEALWKSLHVLKGDIIAWVDTDVKNMHPEFVYGLVGPLLREPRIAYIKGYYHRPIQAGGDLQHEGGGRVTELTVRPLFNLFFPLLSGLVQPLAGEYAGRREVLEQLPFFSGYGVETGLLIDLLERFGLSSIGQVNLNRRVHRNRSLADLSLTAFAIVQVILTRLEQRARINLVEEINRSMKLIRFEEDHLSLVVRHVRDVERPPIAGVPAYRAAHPR